MCIRDRNGAVHHHLIVNTSDALLLQELWTHGMARPSYLRADGDYSKLAAYFAGQQDKEPESPEIEKLRKRRRWSGSRNLIRPKAQVEEVNAAAWREPPAPVKGYIIDKESIEADVSPVTGIPYLFYRMVKIPDRAQAIAETGELLYGAAASARITKLNREEIRHEWKHRADDGRTLQRDHDSREEPEKAGCRKDKQRTGGRI